MGQVSAAHVIGEMPVLVLIYFHFSLNHAAVYRGLWVRGNMVARSADAPGLILNGVGRSRRGPESSRRRNLYVGTGLDRHCRLRTA